MKQPFNGNFHFATYKWTVCVSLERRAITPAATSSSCPGHLQKLRGKEFINTSDGETKVKFNYVSTICWSSFSKHTVVIIPLISLFLSSPQYAFK